MKQMNLDVGFMVDNNIRFYFLAHTPGISSSQLKNAICHDLYRSVEVVVARHGEDVTWAKELPYPVIVYDRTDPSPEDKIAVGQMDWEVVPITKSDRGHETETYLKHIINRWHRLAGHTLFLQGRINDHADNLNRFTNFKKSFSFIGDKLLYSSKHNDAHVPEIFDVYMKIFGEEAPDKITFMHGGLFMASREIIHKRSLEWYQKTLETLQNLPDNKLHSGPGWWGYPERLWDKIITGEHLL